MTIAPPAPYRSINGPILIERGQGLPSLAPVSCYHPIWRAAYAR